MASRRLSAAGLRFLDRSFAHWGTQPPLPLAYRVVDNRTDPNGVATFHT